MVTKHKLLISLLCGCHMIGIAVAVLLGFFHDTRRELDQLARVDNWSHESLVIRHYLMDRRIHELFTFWLVFKSRRAKLAQGQLRTRCRLGILRENLGASKGRMARYHLGATGFMNFRP